MRMTLRHPPLGKAYSLNLLRGFTLVELMIVLAVMAVLLAIAVPSFMDAALSSKLTSHANNLVASTNFARGEAIKRNAIVSMCVSTDGSTCASGGWEQGWIVMCDTTDGETCDTGGPDTLVFQRQQSLPSGFKITESGGADSIDFLPTVIDTNQYTFTVCRATPTVGNQERVVTVTSTRRASVAITNAESCS
jgi:type IV fimbrial biogenesis protein FimT